VRGIETLKQPAGQVSGVARVALNLRGAERLTPAARHGAGRAGPLDAGRDAGRAPRGDRGPPTPAAHRARRVSADCCPAAPAGRPDRPGSPWTSRCRCTSATGCCFVTRVRPRWPSPSRYGRRIRTRATHHWPQRWSYRLGGVAPAGRRHGCWTSPTPAFRRRGAAAVAVPGPRAPGPPCTSAADLLRRHGLLRAADLRAMGVDRTARPGRR